MIESWRLVGPLIVSVIAVAVGYVALRRAKAKRNRGGIIGWSTLVYVGTAYCGFLVLALIDRGESQYVLGTVAGVNSVTLPSARGRGVESVPVTTVALKDEVVEVYGSWVGAGERVCVRRSIGRFTKDVLLEVVSMDECTARQPGLERELRQDEESRRRALDYLEELESRRRVPDEKE